MSSLHSISQLMGAGCRKRMHRASDRGAVNSVVISGVAMIAALCALALSGMAFLATRTGESVAAPHPAAVTIQPSSSTSAPSPIPSPTEEFDSATEESGAPSPSPYPTDGPLPSADAQYTLSFEDVKITLTPGESVSRRFDLDQPLVNPGSDQSDGYLYFSEQPALQFESVQVSIAKTSNATPAECASAIQLSPSATRVKVSQDLVLCTVTNGRGAVNEPERLKMVRMIVDSVASDGTTILTLTAWELPH